MANLSVCQGINAETESTTVPDNPVANLAIGSVPEASEMLVGPVYDFSLINR